MRSTRSQSETSHKVNMAAVVDLTNDDDENQELRVMVNMAPVPKNTVKTGQGRHCVDNQTHRKMNEFGAIVRAKAKADGFVKIEGKSQWKSPFGASRSAQRLTLFPSTGWLATSRRLRCPTTGLSSL